MTLRRCLLLRPGDASDADVLPYGDHARRRRVTLRLSQVKHLHSPPDHADYDETTRFEAANAARLPSELAIITGAVSKLIVLDIDPKHGGDDSLESLERRFGALPSTVESHTGGGGRHLYFEHPGYPVAPPSLHPSGEHYAWRPGRSREERTLAPLPRWFLTAIGIPRSGRSLGDWRKLVQDGVPEGQRNSTIASLTGHLLWHGVDEAVVLELLLPWNRLRCRPPLAAAEVAEVVGSILRLRQQEERAERHSRWPTC